MSEMILTVRKTNKQTIKETKGNGKKVQVIYNFGLN